MENSSANNIGYKVLAGLFLALILSQLSVVVARYAVSISAPWMQEVVTYLHAVLIVVAMPLALWANRHVRIDVLSNQFRRPFRLRIEKIGFCLLLIPMMVGILVSSSDYVLESWRIAERSPQISGLPGLFLIKSLILLFAVFMLLAGLRVWTVKR